MAQVLSGIVSKIPGIPGLPGIPGISGAPTDPAVSGTSTIKGLFSKGFELPWWIHIFLTGIAPFLVLLPYVGTTIFSFPYMFGVNGLNLLATNSMGFAAMKAAMNFFFQMIAAKLSSEFPGQWWLPVARAILYYGNPWFVFDILQIYNPSFASDGYKIPFWNKKTNSVLEKSSTRTQKDIGYTDAKGTISYGWMGAVAIGAAIVLLAPATSILIESLPPEAKAKIDPIFSTIVTIVGGFGAVAGGSVASFVGIPALVSSVQSGFTSIMAGGAAAPQTGGFKSISEMVKPMIRKTTAEQEEEDMSKIFLGILGFIAFSGVSLAVIREKGIPGYTV